MNFLFIRGSDTEMLQTYYIHLQLLVLSFRKKLVILWMCTLVCIFI